MQFRVSSRICRLKSFGTSMFLTQLSLALGQLYNSTPGFVVCCSRKCHTVSNSVAYSQRQVPSESSAIRKQSTWSYGRHLGEILPAQARPKPASGRSRAKAALGNTTCPPSRLRGRFVAILPRSANAKANECQARCRHESLPGCRLLRIDRLGARSEMTSSDTRFVFTRESVSNRQARRKKRVFNRDAASLASTC